MNGSATSFEDELQIPLKLTLPFLALVGLIFIFGNDAGQGSPAQLTMMLFGVLIHVLCAVAWQRESQQPSFARWVAVIAWTAVICLGNVWFSGQAFLMLAFLPAALAALLIGLSAATMTAAGTLLALLLPAVLPGGTGSLTASSFATAVVTTGAMLGIMYAIYRPMGRLSDWFWRYYQEAQIAVDEARDRKVELQQALDDLSHANEQLTRLNIVAQGLRQAAEDARIAKEQFVANVSHELRTPLNMIIGFSEMILQTPETYGGRLPPTLLADLDVIHRNADHLSHLINDVLDLSQIEADQMALSREHAQIAELIDEATTSVRPLYQSKGLYLHTEVQPDLPELLCDRTRIREVLLNLLSNAARFTEEGGVELRARQDGNDIVISVADTGTGIPPESLPRLFQPFQQLDGTIRRRYGGTGLGLSISKRFIELHGGKIWVESRLGAGTTFFFRLPTFTFSPVQIAASPTRWLSPEWEYVQRSRPSMAPKVVIQPRLVVVEAEHALQRLLARYLDGVEIVRATSLEAARGVLAHAPANMLVINGPSVGKELERLKDPSLLPDGTMAVVCSVPGLHEASEALGVAELLVKPITREALLDALDRLGVARGTILIVDDEPDALQLFGRMIAASGRPYHVLLSRDGQEALEVLREYHPDVAFLDLVMPNMDGFQLLEKMREDPALRMTPVVVISARDPAGRPIVSSSLAVTQRGGLSLHQLLGIIEALNKPRRETGQPAGPALPADPSG